jgi:hypothetical protein
MIHPPKTSYRRKSLNCSEEEFFLLVQLVCGPPQHSAFKFVGLDRWSAGVQGWLKETDEGRQFMQCVTSCGEAKSRAAARYGAYCSWWLTQHGTSFQAWRIEGGLNK